MSTEVVSLAGGMLFLLVAIVGGGFAIREISMPRVPHWARVACAVFGILLLMPFALSLLREGTTGSASSPPSTVFTPYEETQEGGEGIEVDTEPATSADQIQVSDLSASARNDPPRGGDTLTVRYSLTNLGQAPVRLEYTFVGARDEADSNKDAEGENEGHTLAVGETVPAGGRIFLDSPGSWTAWPCYVLSGDRYCPHRWQAVTFTVE
jgi:hypothetical protein